MAASRIASSRRLCCKYKCIFYVAFVILCVQFFLYNINIKEADNTSEDREVSGLIILLLFIPLLRQETSLQPVNTKSFKVLEKKKKESGSRLYDIFPAVDFIQIKRNCLLNFCSCVVGFYLTVPKLFVMIKKCSLKRCHHFPL